MTTHFVNGWQSTLPVNSAIKIARTETKTRMALSFFQVQGNYEPVHKHYTRKYVYEITLPENWYKISYSASTSFTSHAISIRWTCMNTEQLLRLTFIDATGMTRFTFAVNPAQGVDRLARPRWWLSQFAAPTQPSAAASRHWVIRWHHCWHT